MTLIWWAETDFPIDSQTKWESYPRKLWNTIGIGVFHASILSFRLHALCAAPRNLPVIWQWSQTLLALAFSLAIVLVAFSMVVWIPLYSAVTFLNVFSFSLSLTILVSKRSISSVSISNLPLQIQQVSASANLFLSSSVSIRSCLLARTLLIVTNSWSILRTNSWVAFSPRYMTGPQTVPSSKKKIYTNSFRYPIVSKLKNIDSYFIIIFL